MTFLEVGGGGGRGLIDVLCVTHRQREGGGETASATWHFDIYGALKIIINLNNLSDVDTIGLHIPPTALKYGTPVFNADDDGGGGG